VQRNDELFPDNLARFLAGKPLNLQITPALIAGGEG